MNATDPIWSVAEQLVLKLQVVEILVSLFPRLDLDEELEVVEITALMGHVNGLVSDARKDAQAIMKRGLDQSTGVRP